ncbi:MAG TPA: hypothetical protein VN736_25380 [Candidatus Limnocylindrales bacterium]|nr:hypothetical protein [Candidatus Limnocylindrales bacterium]
MNIQYVRLDERVCEPLNRLAMDQRRTVSDLVNEILGRYLETAEKSEQVLPAE